MNHSPRNYKKIESTLIVRLSMLALLMFGAVGATQAQWSNPSGIIYTTNTSDKVGIGTASPSAALHVKQDMGSTVTAVARFRNTNSTAKTTRIQLEDSSGTVGDGLIDYVHSDSNTSNHYLGLGLNSPTQLILRYGGNVGIGTTSPQQRLSVFYSTSNALPGLSVSETSAAASTGVTVNNADASGNSAILFNVGDANKGRIKVDNSGLMTLSGLGLGNNLTINSSGNVGINNPSPNYKLDIKGSINVSADGSDLGNITAAGTINAKYQDVAEWVPSSDQLSAGTVVVLDSTKSNQVTSSSVSYDTRVAGVISEQPGIALGEKSDGKVLVATTGRVRVKVDASKGPIHIGDLLVTSDVAGVAMKSEPVEFAGRKMHMPGTLIGKALEPLAKGSGEILVLLSLQ